MTIYWRYHSDALRLAGACPPERAKLDYRDQAAGGALRQEDFVRKCQAIEAGDRRGPEQCPPMRAMARTGYVLRTPVETVIKGRPYSPQREFESAVSRGAAIEVSGSKWPDSDSEYVASWISGSDYLKLQSGIDLLVPRKVEVLQGPAQNAQLYSSTMPLIGFTAVERWSPGAAVEQEPEYYQVELNFIYRAPPIGRKVVIPPNTIIGWFLPLERSNFLIEPIARLPLRDASSS